MIDFDINFDSSVLDTIKKRIQKAKLDAVQASVDTMESDAKELCPVDTGQLRWSIGQYVKETENGDVTGFVGTNDEVAPYVEFGTGQRGRDTEVEGKKPGVSGYRSDWKGMPAQPFLYPALLTAKQELPATFEEKLKENLRE